MRKIIEYFRSLFCKHEFELLQQADVHDRRPVTFEMYDTPNYTMWTYMCKKCGYVKIVSNKRK